MALDKPLNLSFEGDADQSAMLSAPTAPNATLAQKIEELQKQLQAKNTILEAKNQEISELKIKNRQLLEENKATQERQKQLDEELRKAEAQIELIQELLQEDEASEASNNQERSNNV